MAYNSIQTQIRLIVSVKTMITRSVVSQSGKPFVGSFMAPSARSSLRRKSAVQCEPVHKAPSELSNGRMAQAHLLGGTRAPESLSFATVDVQRPLAQEQTSPYPD